MEGVDDLENTFKILLATDNHIGYGESNPVRENDTFVTFEEILKIALRENVDFILLGGDLFHDARPSPYCINKCTELIRKYCLGDRPVAIELLSDPSYNFQGINSTVNYEDPNMNVSIPIFSIHGNHDDPTGKRQISALNLLASAGLINYFGRWDDVTRVEVNPVLLQKGNTRLALYGLSHIRDERLARLFLDRKVIVKTPENVDDWFNLMVLHQNRANRGAKNFIPETCIPDCMDLAMWGHEHDCIIEPAFAGAKCRITQPGSSVATSLSEGEAVKKQVGLLRVRGKQYTLLGIELKTVRPFIFKHMILDPPDKNDFKMKFADTAKQKIAATVEEMIREARDMGRSRNLLPLIRLVIKYPDERQIFNTIRFGQAYTTRVANPQDMLKFVPLQKKTRTKGPVLLGDDEEDADDTVDRVEDLLPKYFSEKNQLMVLSLDGMKATVKKFIDSNDSTAPLDMIYAQEEATLKKLNELQPEEEDFMTVLETLRAARQPDEFQSLLDHVNRPKAPTNQNDVPIRIDDSDDDSPSTSTLNKPVGRGTRGRRGPRATRGRGRGK